MILLSITTPKGFFLKIANLGESFPGFGRGPSPLAAGSNSGMFKHQTIIIIYFLWFWCRRFERLILSFCETSQVHQNCFHTPSPWPWQDRASVVPVARRFKKSFTLLALKLSYQKTSLLKKILCFKGKNFAPARPTPPLSDELCPRATNFAPARPTPPLFSEYIIYTFMHIV